jgi:thioredoxin 1
MTARRPVLALASAALVALGLGAALLMQRTEVPTAPAPSVIPLHASPADDDALQRALRQGKPTVVEFGANACAACREMKPVLEALKREHGDRIGVLNVDLIAQKDANYIQRYGIQLMPTQVFYDAQGRETGRHMGKISGDQILARLQGAAP